MYDSGVILWGKIGYNSLLGAKELTASQQELYLTCRMEESIVLNKQWSYVTWAYPAA